MRPVWPILSGVCATMTGIGLQRFAYAPLLPAMVQQGVLSGGEAGALGAFNLGGYLLGAALAPAVGRALTLRWAMRLAMLVACFGFAMCALPGGLWWLAPFRAVAGFAGGVLMVLAGPAVQAVVPASMRGLAAGLVFAGVGIGIVTGALLVPAMLPLGLGWAWLSLAGLALGLALVSWRLWPDVAAPPAMRLPRLRGAAGWLVLSYACAAVAQTAHMVWWPDYIARGMGLGTGAGAAFWVLFGVAAALGPAGFGRLGDRFGTRPALRGLMAAQVAGLVLPLVTHEVAALAVSAVLAGATALGSTALTLTRARELVPAQASGVWRICTTSFGVAQTVTGFGMAWLYAATGGHAAIFGVALVMAVSALAAARS
jgi:predicted MFS family arabinose efflux permease